MRQILVVAYHPKGAGAHRFRGNWVYKTMLGVSSTTHTARVHGLPFPRAAVPGDLVSRLRPAEAEKESTEHFPLSFRRSGVMGDCVLSGRITNLSSSMSPSSACAPVLK